MVDKNYKFDRTKDGKGSPVKKSPSKGVKREDEDHCSDEAPSKKKSKKSKHHDSD
jgi:hypothetical protein